MEEGAPVVRSVHPGSFWLGGGYVVPRGRDWIEISCFCGGKRDPLHGRAGTMLDYYGVHSSGGHRSGLDTQLGHRLGLACGGYCSRPQRQVNYMCGGTLFHTSCFFMGLLITMESQRRIGRAFVGQWE